MRPTVLARVVGRVWFRCALRSRGCLTIGNASGRAWREQSGPLQRFKRYRRRQIVATVSRGGATTVATAPQVVGAREAWVHGIEQGSQVDGAGSNDLKALHKLNTDCSLPRVEWSICYQAGPVDYTADGGRNNARLNSVSAIIRGRCQRACPYTIRAQNAAMLYALRLNVAVVEMMILVGEAIRRRSVMMFTDSKYVIHIV